MANRALPLLVLLLALSFACSSPSTPGDDGGMPMTADTGTDSTPNPSDVATVGELEVGTNDVAQATPDGFVLLDDGDEIPFVFGVQGSWMVVLAFRTHDLLDGGFDVVAEISIDGVESGDIWLEAQETFPGGDGWDYYYSLFLPIVDDEPPAEGTPVHVVMRITDETGATHVRAYDLVAGPADGP